MSFVHRPVVMGHRGMVVAGHHLAAEAGAAMLRRGGNAMDAAVAAAACLSAAIPHMNGVGGDVFALWYDAATGEVTAINGSGGAPQAATIDRYRAEGYETVPERGPLSISVPGAVGAWATSLSRFGRLSLRVAMAPAIALAREGLPLDRVQAAFFNGESYAGMAARNPALAAIYGPAGGRRMGELLRQPALAASLSRIAYGGPQALYGGSLGRALEADLEAAGALLRIEDLAAHHTLLQTPLSVPFRGHEVYSSPPNTQGIALILLLGLLEASEGEDEPFLARFMRVKRLAFAQRDRLLGDPALAAVPRELLLPEGMAALLDGRSPGGSAFAPGPHPGDTTCCVTMDRDGNAVSWVQSLFQEFGSGVVSPETGIVMQNRLSLASLEPGGPNSLAPGRRCFHTLTPAIVLKDGRCVLTAATPGDHGQPQSLAQLMVRMFAEGMDVQAAVEAPRIRHDEGREVMAEDRIPDADLAPLAEAGYEVRRVGGWARLMGGMNAIHCLDGAVRMGGADPRRACYAVAE